MTSARWLLCKGAQLLVLRRSGQHPLASHLELGQVARVDPLAGQKVLKDRLAVVQAPKGAGDDVGAKGLLR